MKKFILSILLLLLAPALHATTWHIRTDGGSATQCTGTTNAAYPGSGSAQACAFNHPFWLLNQSTWAWNISANDTIQVDDLGPYYIGQGPNKGLGVSWPHCVGDNADCDFPPLPNNVAILGKNAGACSSGGQVDYSKTTKLVGINGVFHLIYLEAAQSPVLKCLDFTQADTCTVEASGGSTIMSTAASGGTATYGWQLLSSLAPVLHARTLITGTTNGSGAFNITGNVTGITYSQFSVTNSQYVASTTTSTYAWTLVSGFKPVNGQLVVITGTTNGGGLLDGTWGISNVTGTTSGTFDVVADRGGTNFGSHSESAAGVDQYSGYFTMSGVAGTIGTASESGLEVPDIHCRSGQNFAVAGIRVEYLNHQGPTNALLEDIVADGISGQGLIGGHLNTSGTDVFTARRVWVVGNGAAGWDSDGGGCSTDCETVGTMNLDHILAEWNGCVAVKPYTSVPGDAGFDACVNQSYGGNGDNFVFIAANATLNVSNSIFRYGAQDCLDGLHLGDDPSKHPSIHLTNSWAEGCEGQTFKLGAYNVTAYNNVSISNCRAQYAAYTPSNVNPLGPTGWNTFVGIENTCRAGGDEWTIAYYDGATIDIESNTSVGYGATMYDFSCTGTCTTASTFIFRNNLSIGKSDPASGLLASAFYFNTGFNPFAGGASIIRNNSWYNMRGNPGTCPEQSPYETNALCNQDPLLVGESDINAFNPHLTSSSPQIGAGVTVSGITTDYLGSCRPNPPSIGAYEYVTGGCGSQPGFGLGGIISIGGKN